MSVLFLRFYLSQRHTVSVNRTLYKASDHCYCSPSYRLVNIVDFFVIGKITPPISCQFSIYLSASQYTAVIASVFCRIVDEIAISRDVGRKWFNNEHTAAVSS